jgi:hypothetical protein
MDMWLIKYSFAIVLLVSQITVAEDFVEDNSGNWLDSSHRYVHSSTDQLAGWIDGFFGLPRSDLESAQSSLRLVYENNWQEGEGDSDAVRLRGKVRLPQINKRLSLLFEDEEGINSSDDNNINAIDDNNQGTDIGLSYNVWEHLESRIDFKLGLRSSGKGKVKARYRYESPWGDHFTNRLVETLYFIDGEGFGTSTRYELDRAIDQDKILRWSNNATFAEDSNGVEWSTRIILGDRLTEKSAISYFIGSAGETRPVYLTTFYGMGVRYRQSIVRPWIFYELEPGYGWFKDDVESKRDGRVTFTIRFELLFEK